MGGSGYDEEPAASGASRIDTMSWEELGALAYSDHKGTDHTLRELHTEVSRGLQVLDASTLSADGESLGEYTEADVQGDLLAVATTTGLGVDVRVSLLDRASLPDIVVAGEFDEPDAYGDVKFDKEMPFVYVPFPGARPNGLRTQVLGFSIWDISDPAHATRVGEAVGSGCHMLNTLRIGGESYVWCAALTGPTTYRIVQLPDGSWTGVIVASDLPQGDPEIARYLSYYQSLSPIGPALIGTPHDMTAQLDPLTGEPILVAAYELQGFRIFDVANPVTPIQLGYWRGESGEAPIDRIHTAALARIGDRRIGIGATETFTNVVPKVSTSSTSPTTRTRSCSRRGRPPASKQTKASRSACTISRSWASGSTSPTSTPDFGCWTSSILRTPRRSRCARRCATRIIRGPTSRLPACR